MGLSSASKRLLGQVKGVTTAIAKAPARVYRWRQKRQEDWKKRGKNSTYASVFDNKF